MDNKLLQAVKEVFPDFDDKIFSPNLELEAIPDWDSMNSINLQLALEEVFQKDFADAPLNGEDTVSDLMIFIKGEKAEAETGTGRMSEKYSICFDKDIIEISFIDKISELGDTQKFLSLIKEIYKRDFPVEVYQWYELLNGTNIWAVAREKDSDRLVAIYGLLQMNFFFMGDEVDGYLCHNTGVIHQYEEKGLFQYIGETALNQTLKDHMLALGFPNRFAVRGHKKIGWQEVGEMHFYHKREFRKFQGSEFERVYEVSEFKEEINEFTLSYGRKTDFSIRKDHSFLNWRISKPNHDYLCFIYREGNTIQGYMIFKFYLDRQKNHKKGHIIDIMAESKEIYSILIRKAESLSNSMNVDILNVWVFEKNPLTETLSREGFSKSDTDYDYSTLLYSHEPSIQGRMGGLAGEKIYLSLADNDVF